MIREWIKRAGERIEDRLRHLCGALSPDKRVIAIITLFVLFAALSLYSTVSAFYSLGLNDGERIRIAHLRRLAPHPGHGPNPQSLGSHHGNQRPAPARPTTHEQPTTRKDPTTTKPRHNM